MEVFSAVVTSLGIAANVSRGLWKLTNAWSDAPRDVHWLRDDVARTHEFLASVKYAIANGLPDQTWNESVNELVPLIQRSEVLLTEINSIVTRIAEGRVPTVVKKQQAHDGIQPISARRRVVWMIKEVKMKKLRAAVIQNNAMIYGKLVAVNV